MRVVSRPIAGGAAWGVFLLGCLLLSYAIGSALTHAMQSAARTPAAKTSAQIVSAPPVLSPSERIRDVFDELATAQPITVRPKNKSTIVTSC